MAGTADRSAIHDILYPHPRRFSNFGGKYFRNSSAVSGIGNGRMNHPEPD